MDNNESECIKLIVLQFVIWDPFRQQRRLWPRWSPATATGVSLCTAWVKVLVKHPLVHKHAQDTPQPRRRAPVPARAGRRRPRAPPSVQESVTTVQSTGQQHESDSLARGIRRLHVCRAARDVRAARIAELARGAPAGWRAPPPAPRSRRPPTHQQTPLLQRSLCIHKAVQTTFVLLSELWTVANTNNRLLLSKTRMSWYY